MPAELNHPAELPAELESGGGGSHHFPGRPWPSEIPPVETLAGFSSLAVEVLALVGRVSALENAQVSARLLGGRPTVHELPRVTEDLHVLPVRIWPNELPPKIDVAAVLAEMSTLQATLNQVSAQVRDLTAALAAKG